MPYPAKAIANFFIDSALLEEKPITPMKVQKLVYFAHGWNLALSDKPLINEQVEAWKFGPVIRSLYASLAEYGNSPITEKISELMIMRSGKRIRFAKRYPSIDESDSESREFLKDIWEIYRDFTAVQLSNITHKKDSPWRLVYDSHHGELPRGTDIPTDLIRKSFVSEYEATK